MERSQLRQARKFGCARRRLKRFEVWSRPASDCAAEQAMLRKLEKVKLGMSREDVTKILGAPDETRQVPFGGEILTGWVYHSEAKLIQVWFDERGTLRLKNPR